MSQKPMKDTVTLYMLDCHLSLIHSLNYYLLKICIYSYYLVSIKSNLCYSFKSNYKIQIYCYLQIVFLVISIFIMHFLVEFFKKLSHTFGRSKMAKIKKTVKQRSFPHNLIWGMLEFQNPPDSGGEAF